MIAKPSIAMVRRLRFDAVGDSSDLVAQITRNRGNYMPPVLFALAQRYYKREQIEEAIFWLNAATRCSVPARASAR
jgi:hypothetical protein